MSDETETEKPRLYFWLGEDGELEEVTEAVFLDRQVEARKAWEDWIALKDLDIEHATRH